MENRKKFVAVLGLIGCIGFMLAGLYIYLFKSAPLQLLLLDIAFFGMGVVISIISLISKRESWTLDKRNLTKTQSIIMGICCVVFSICSLYVALFFSLHFVLKVILFSSFLLIVKGSIKFFKSSV